ncbi:helix-turn-helix domain-containing protein [Streptomyces edwardsiae]|uniref:Helix-turn-helix transcriptional regulator n=1 Tax=Streptomyces edwardsiae TaxID=3075527 RepID=A0ABU2Q5D4_9ACTN|nr:helix-turn-helix transcriptional regulator [Streptomyces sp. DSM 41636]MDT0398705.1 helix-turn-helix transcriptional regulator [Streptomyces sp. DSM 41636]
MSETVAEAAGEAGSPEPGASAGILRVFGRQMKLCRIRAGLERAEVGARTGYSPSTITSYELGRRIPPSRFIDAVDDLLDAGGLLKEMKEEVARAQYPAFFRDAARLETEALALSVYDAQVVNGLLQTEEYARAVFSTMRPPLEDAVVDQRVEARLARQRIFDRRPTPLVSFVMDESVLRRPIGGRSVLRGQLEHLLLFGQRRTVELQVLPLSREQNAGLAGPFMLFDNQEGRKVAYVEVQNVSHVHAEQHLVRGLEAKYGTLRSQALTPQESLTHIENLLGEL